MKDLKKLAEHNQRFALYEIRNHHSPDIIKRRAEGLNCLVCDCGFTNNSDLHTYSEKGNEIDMSSNEVFVHGYPAVCWDCWGEALDESDRKSGVYKKAKVETFHSRSIRRKMIKKDITYKKMEPKLSKIIEQHNKEKINRLMNQISCKHKWVKFNTNFPDIICQKCNYDPGEDHRLNKLIEKLLAKQK